MLEEPNIRHNVITASVQVSYGLTVEDPVFLPIGADVNTAAYRLVTPDGEAYFLKLRKRAFDEIIVKLPAYLSAQGLKQVISPLPAKNGQFWSPMGAYKMILYPYIEGKDAYECNLTDAQWRELGAALKQIHTTELPPQLEHQVRREDFNPRARSRVKGFQAQVEAESFLDPVADQLARFMREKSTEISLLVARAERLASELHTHDFMLHLCHSDLHPGNLHLTPDGKLYIVDWDNPILAPKEHDLMHIGASARWQGRHIKSMFYQGYGKVQVDGMALAYYRCERIIQDIAEFCKLLLSSTDGGSDRQQSLAYFTRQFEPGQEVDIACRGGDETQLNFYACFKPREHA